MPTQPSADQTQDQRDLNLAFEAVLATADGRAVIRWVLGECNVYGSMFGGEEHAATDFNLGGRNVGLKLIAKLNEIGPTVYPQLLLDAGRSKPKEEPTHVVDDEDAAPQ